MELKSRIAFRKHGSSGVVPVLSHAKMRCVSDDRSWRGLKLEAGSTRSWLVEEVMVDGHFVSINLCDEPLRLHAGDASGTWRSVAMPPGSFWINPEGQPFSLRVEMPAYWAGALVDGRFLDTVLGGHVQLNAGFGIVDDQLQHLTLALIHQAEPKNLAADTDGRLAGSLIHSFVLALAVRHGERAPDFLHRGGVTQHQLKVLLQWVDSHLDSSLKIEDMAATLGLSPAHFSREFKRTTGSTPWGYVVRKRLQRACALLREGGTICSIATQCGFADQAHFSRLFKQHLGITPKEYQRTGGLPTAPGHN